MAMLFTVGKYEAIEARGVQAIGKIARLSSLRAGTCRHGACMGSPSAVAHQYATDFSMRI
jgi:hypothetical protein